MYLNQRHFQLVMNIEINGVLETRHADVLLTSNEENLFSRQLEVMNRVIKELIGKDLQQIDISDLNEVFPPPVGIAINMIEEML